MVKSDPVAVDSYSLQINLINYLLCDLVTGAIEHDISDQDIQTGEELFNLTKKSFDLARVSLKQPFRTHGLLSMYQIAVET
ncbi:hypothetical protein N9L26_01515 [Candidatus Pacebacteria bacterium]|nr:hypothetical protein [Candidatus Paceibacterota bacterium]